MKQIEKNTVKAEAQLNTDEYIIFENPENQGLRIMFLGNSITLHGVKPEIGWNNHCGMAASEKEKDYVHILMSRISQIKSDTAYCICQGSQWELSYKNGIANHYKFEKARDFGADIIIVRIIENCSINDFDSHIFEQEYLAFLHYLSGDNNARIILTTGFWEHPGDAKIREIANKNGWAIVELGDLGEKDCMKAIGNFEHSGVANHPGDLGMQAIADRIFDVLKSII